MDLPALQAFLIVAETGSFSAAAERLFLTQPAVSKRIAALEIELGHPLFDRIGRQTTLTEAGRALLPHALRVVEGVEDGRRALANLNERVEGVLRLGTSHHIGLHHLPPVLRSYIAAYPAVGLDIRFLDSDTAYAAVRRGELDLAVITLPSTPGELVEIGVWTDPLVVVAGRSHPLSQRDIQLGDLARFPAILPTSSTSTRAMIDAALGAAGIEATTSLTTNYLETIRMMVSVGLGWSLLPRTLLSDDLVPLPFDGLSIERTLGVVHHGERTLSNAARAMVQEITTLNQVTPGTCGAPIGANC